MDKKVIESFVKREKALKHKHKTKKEEQSHPSSTTSSKNNKKLKTSNETDDSFDKSSAQYRDRAQERRQGINKDFEHDPEEFKTLFSRYDDEDDIEDDDARRLREIEESKYLGGDVEHTHLVKGLDYRLLQKIKAEQRQAQKKTEKKPEINRDVILGDLGDDNECDSEEEEFRMQAVLEAAKNQKIDLEKLKKGQSKKSLLDGDKWSSNRSHMFARGRTTYVISLDEDSDDPPVQTILR